MRVAFKHLQSRLAESSACASLDAEGNPDSVLRRAPRQTGGCSGKDHDGSVPDALETEEEFQDAVDPGQAGMAGQVASELVGSASETSWTRVSAVVISDDSEPSPPRVEAEASVLIDLVDDGDEVPVDVLGKRPAEEAAAPGDDPLDAERSALRLVYSRVALAMEEQDSGSLPASSVLEVTPDGGAVQPDSHGDGIRGDGGGLRRDPSAPGASVPPGADLGLGTSASSSGAAAGETLQPATKRGRSQKKADDQIGGSRGGTPVAPRDESRRRSPGHQGCYATGNPYNFKLQNFRAD